MKLDGCSFLRSKLGFLFLCALVAFWPSPKTAAAQQSPNIIFIYADDLGYGDLSCFGSKAIKTPNLDRMAAEGLRLTNFYSVSPVCTPSRTALMTGRYAARMGIEQMHLSNVLTFQDKTGVPTNETLISEALKARGYATAAIGKWHLGHLAPYRPTDRGFDVYFGIPYSNDMQPSMLWRGTEIIEQPVKQETLTLRYTQEAIAFIEKNKGKPFFLYLPHNMPHIPLYASEKFKGKSAAGAYGDAVEELDWSVGEILAALKRQGLDKDTLVVFSSDNGPWYQGSPGELRGRKGWTYDGGVRVPFIARWPGKIKPRSVSDEPLATIDFFQTALAIAGDKNPAVASKLPLDGKNALPFLLGQTKKPPENLYLFFDKEFLQTARWGRWKIHVARWNIPRYTAASGQQKNNKLARPELYDMTFDAGENFNVAERHPDLVKELQSRIAVALKTFPEEIQRANADLISP
ncbi:MAG: sulfatase [Acidobacteria bacterium]|nr:sulfatase [Acidobacteriota bacterium]